MTETSPTLDVGERARSTPAQGACNRVNSGGRCSQQRAAMCRVGVEVAGGGDRLQPAPLGHDHLAHSGLCQGRGA